MVALRKWGPRFAAPAAFLLGVTVAVQLVRAGLDDESEAATAVQTATATTAPTATRRTTRTATQPARQFTRVETGDTLQVIADEHDTTVGRLLVLNPGLDPNALQIGQRIRVR